MRFKKLSPVIGRLAKQEKFLLTLEVLAMSMPLLEKDQENLDLSGKLLDTMEYVLNEREVFIRKSEGSRVHLDLLFDWIGFYRGSE